MLYILASEDKPTLTQWSLTFSNSYQSNEKGLPQWILPLRLGLTHPPSNKRGWAIIYEKQGS